MFNYIRRLSWFQLLSIFPNFLPGDVADFKDRGFQPAASIKAVPSLVKRLPEGRKVGYGCTHTTRDEEWMATFPLGYADGYSRLLSNKGFIVREKTGKLNNVVLSYGNSRVN